MLLIASFAIAGAPKSYQATDLVLEFAGGHISVHKGNNKSFRGHLCFLIVTTQVDRLKAEGF